MIWPLNKNCKRGFWGFFCSTLFNMLHLPLFGFHCVLGFWYRTQDSCDFVIGHCRLSNHSGIRVSGWWSESRWFAPGLWFWYIVLLTAIQQRVYIIFVYDTIYDDSNTTLLQSKIPVLLKTQQKAYAHRTGTVFL